MTKQMKAAVAAMLMVGTLPMVAQTSQTDVVKVAPGQTKKTVIHRKNGATDTVISEGTTGSAHKKPVHHVTHRAVVAKAPVESATARQIRELEEKQAAQQAQIDALTSANAAKDAALSQAQQTAAAAQQQAQTATSQAQSVQSTVQQNSSDVQSLKSTVTDLSSTSAGLAATISATKTELTDKIESPTVLHYKGVTITPVAFFAFEGVWRERSVNSDINTPFTAIPFLGANEAYVSELNFSGRQSRIGGLFEGKAKNMKLSGYFEADFLGTGTSSNNNQSNSYVLRQRQIWGQVATNSGFTVTGGQMWSLVTENGKGTDNRTEKLPNTIDPQYMVGFSWTRQPAIRVQKKFGDYKTGAVTVAVSAEQAQITNFTVEGAAPTEYFFAGPGQNGGLYNAAGNIGNGNTAGSAGITNYANNAAPDLVGKVAIDFPKAHIELGGIGRFMRDIYYAPSVTAAAPTAYVYATTLTSTTTPAGGGFGSIRVSPSKYIDVAVQAMGGTGIGRYGSAQLADATLNPDSSLNPLPSYHGMFSLESHPAPKLDVFAYYGGEYVQRTVQTSLTGSPVGYGLPTDNNSGCYAFPTFSGTSGTGASITTTGTCAGKNKDVQEGMVGFTYRVASSPKFGRLQYSVTYSYLQRQLWAGTFATTAGVNYVQTPVASPTTNDSMVHFGMRYYIP